MRCCNSPDICVALTTMLSNQIQREREHSDVCVYGVNVRGELVQRVKTPVVICYLCKSGFQVSLLPVFHFSVKTQAQSAMFEEAGYQIIVVLDVMVCLHLSHVLMVITWSDKSDLLVYFDLMYKSMCMHCWILVPREINTAASFFNLNLLHNQDYYFIYSLICEPCKAALIND